jgi:hypothetical protein
LFFSLAGCAGGNALGGQQVASTTVTTSPTTTTSPSTPATATPATPVATPATPAGSHTLSFVNNCAQTVWVGALTNGSQFALPDNGGWQLDHGQSHSVVVAGNWGGRFWGRTGCTTDNGVFKCTSGDCGGVTCDGRGGQPASLAEFTLLDQTGKDFYDISLVDAYNLPMEIAPSANTVPASAVSGQVCGSPTCAANIDRICPAELQQKDASGNVVACLSACSEYNTPQTCCKGAYDTSAMCPPTTLSEVFKTACHDAYSYAYDDKSSTYTCTATGYTVTFCPGASVGL